MSLTTAQQVDVRRYMGFGVYGAVNWQIFSVPAFSKVGVSGAWVGISLPDRLANLQPEEETVVINQFLTPLNTIEAAIQGVGSNLDTESAGIWKHNANELRDRQALYRSLRLGLCALLGFAPGPELAGQSKVIRT